MSVILRCPPTNEFSNEKSVGALPPSTISVTREVVGRGYLMRTHQPTTSSVSSSSTTSTAAASSGTGEGSLFNNSQTSFSSFADGGGNGGSSSRVKAPKEGDYYDLLGLYPFKWDCTLEEVEEGYKRALVVFHPDKRKTGNKEQDDEHEQTFLSVKKAYSTLTDKAMKLRYDSICEFDEIEEQIPSSKEKFSTPLEFFNRYGPIFAKNSRFSVIQPVPSLGDMTTGLSDVDKFYNFWFSFDSWRDFTLRVKEDLDGSDDRYERRRRLQKAKKEAEKMKKKDNQRLAQLVDRAYSVDPRVKELKKFQAEEKKRKKREAKNRRKGGNNSKNDSSSQEAAAGAKEEKQANDNKAEMAKLVACAVSTYKKKQISRGRRQLKRLVKETREKGDVEGCGGASDFTDEALTETLQHLCLPSMLQLAGCFENHPSKNYLALTSELADDAIRYDIQGSELSFGYGVLKTVITEYSRLAKEHSGKKEVIQSALQVFLNNSVEKAASGN